MTYITRTHPTKTSLNGYDLIMNTKNIGLTRNYLILPVSRSKYQIFMNATTLAEVVFVVFYITLPGQILENTSSRFADAAYESSWYDGDARFRRIIYIIIARSQKPCTLRALGYADVNFRTYSKICSSAWSYLSVLNQMYQNVDFDF